MSWRCASELIDNFRWWLKNWRDDYSKFKVREEPKLWKIFHFWIFIKQFIFSFNHTSFGIDWGWRDLQESNNYLNLIILSILHSFTYFLSWFFLNQMQSFIFTFKSFSSLLFLFTSTCLSRPLITSEATRFGQTVKEGSQFGLGSQKPSSITPSISQFANKGQYFISSLLHQNHSSNSLSSNTTSHPFFFSWISPGSSEPISIYRGKYWSPNLTVLRWALLLNRSLWLFYNHISRSFCRSTLSHAWQQLAWYAMSFDQQANYLTYLSPFQHPDSVKHVFDRFRNRWFESVHQSPTNSPEKANGSDEFKSNQSALNLFYI